VKKLKAKDFKGRRQCGVSYYLFSFQEYVIVVSDAPTKEKAEGMIQTTRKNLGARRPK
jgi:hypothetical protein